MKAEVDDDLSQPREDDGENLYFYPWEARFKQFISPFHEFVEQQNASGIVLMITAVTALIVANSPWRDVYEHMIHVPLVLDAGPYELKFSLLHWINEGLMVFFFFVVGLEIKREILVGELSDMRKAALPVIAALGGMIVPAILYTLTMPSGYYARGWGIPMATDIAFCIAAMVMLGKRIPEGLMVFLVTLAIADDIGAVIVIAVFYTKTLHYGALGAAALLCVLLLFMNHSGVRRGLPYLLVGALIWLALLKSGVHATIAGILVAFSIPAHAHYDQSLFVAHMNGMLKRFAGLHSPERIILSNSEQQTILHTMKEKIFLVESPLQRILEHMHFPVVMVIVPAFALVNTGIPLGLDDLRQSIAHPVTLGVIAGLVAGKPIGISLFTLLSLKTGLVSLPSAVKPKHIIGVGMLGGIGFTMSIFVSELSFGADPATLRMAKTGIFLSSFTAWVLGYIWLRLTSGKLTNPRHAG
ncbi:MAG TPA: Na+/H+ antiporter NhaA [Deltaproteobacteria bacterium]|nr:Na+/H+ antiporter NhaA [Deltaproteobacteria bacterium]